MKIKFWVLFTLSIFFVACVTVNIYFPATAAEKTAEEIVKEVREQVPQKEQKEEKKEDQPAAPETSFWRFETVAYAQEEALGVSNASIRALKTSIKARYPKLIPYLQKGVVGEGKAGFLEAINWEGLSLPDKAKVKRLVEAENRDRKSLYAEVAKALQIKPNQMEKLQKIFARQWQKTVSPGSWVQTEEGKWVRK